MANPLDVGPWLSWNFRRWPQWGHVYRDVYVSIRCAEKKSVTKIVMLTNHP
jgi:hypothetical protein